MSTAISRISTNWAAIRALAPQRFDAYVRPGDTDKLDAIARYAWNMEVCSVLYIPLHTLEITFRNQVHNALSTLHGPRWYDQRGFLLPDELSMVVAAKRKLTQMNRALDPDRVVADLSFGFWTRIYGRAYNRTVVSPTLPVVFPHYAGTGRLGRATVSPKLRDARHLRNRVSHHEHVVFDAQLPQQYRDIVELIAWMHPQLADLSSVNDDFLAVYGKTWRAYRPIIEAVYG